MANLLIKPTTGSGNKLILQDQDGGDAIEVADTGTTLTAPTLAGEATASGNLTVTGDFIPSTPLSNRNMIINGGMQVWQRTTSTTVADSTWAAATADRWYPQAGTGENYSTELENLSNADIGTTGQATAIQIDCTVAGSVDAGHLSYLGQKIEAQNCKHLKYGSSSAENLTLSFWVKSSKIGTYCIGFDKEDGTRYSIGIEYTIATTGWEYKTITISPTAGSTALITSGSGEIDNNTGIGLELRFWLQAGTNLHGANNTWISGSPKATSNQVNFLDSTSNQMFITGVQLELGSNATPFEHRSYGEELYHCCRYYQKAPIAGEGTCTPALQNGSTNYIFTMQLIAPLRASPSLTRTGNPTMCRHNGYETQSGTNNVNYKLNLAQITCSGAGLSGGSDMHGGMMYCGGSTFEWDAELL